MSSAWLIRRFIDPRARFTFAETPPAGGAAIPFDMYGVEFSHTDHGCTFETLVARFVSDRIVEARYSVQAGAEAWLTVLRNLEAGSHGLKIAN